MRGTITATVYDLGFQSVLTIELAYNAWKGEKVVMYDRNGDGYPGSPPGCELTDVTVICWDMLTLEPTRERDHHWLWNALDVIAAEIIEKDWTTYGDLCLEDAAEQSDPY